MCILRGSLSYQRARHIRCFEELVAEAGNSCVYGRHQWHHVEAAVYFWILKIEVGLQKEVKSSSEFSVAHCLVGCYAQRKAQTQTLRDTVNKLKWRMMLGKNESGMVNFASENNRNIASCSTLQDPEKLNTSSRICSQDLTCECVKAGEKSKDNISCKTKTPERT